MSLVHCPSQRIELGFRFHRVYAICRVQRNYQLHMEPFTQQCAGIDPTKHPVLSVMPVTQDHFYSINATQGQVLSCMLSNTIFEEGTYCCQTPFFTFTVFHFFFHFHLQKFKRDWWLAPFTSGVPTLTAPLIVDTSFANLCAVHLFSTTGH